jgi:hypothetical protein
MRSAPHTHREQKDKKEADHEETDHEGSHPGTCCIVTDQWDCAAGQRIFFVSWSADLLVAARSFTSGLSAGLTVAELAAAAGSQHQATPHRGGLHACKQAPHRRYLAMHGDAPASWRGCWKS